MATKGIIEKLNERKLKVFYKQSLAILILKAPKLHAGSPRSYSRWINDLVSLKIISMIDGGQPVDDDIIIDYTAKSGPYFVSRRASTLEVTCVLTFKTVIGYPITVKLVGRDEKLHVCDPAFIGRLYCWKSTNEEIAALVAKELR